MTLAIALVTGWVREFLFVMLVLIGLGVLSFIVTKAPFIEPLYKQILQWILFIVGVVFLFGYLLRLLGYPIW